MSKSLKSELDRHLAAVSAPDELWDRVCERRAPRRREFYVTVWAAAAILLSLGGGSFAAWRGGSVRGASGNEARPVQELRIRPAAEFSRGILKSDSCVQCHTI